MFDSIRCTCSQGVFLHESTYDSGLVLRREALLHAGTFDSESLRLSFGMLSQELQSIERWSEVGNLPLLYNH